jgi:hypothetical protein
MSSAPNSHVVKGLYKRALFNILTSSLLFVGLVGLFSCANTPLAVQPFVPPQYLDCIEISPLELSDYYFNYQPLYIWFPTADEALTGKAVIMKNIEITEGMIETSTKSFFKVNSNVLVKPQNPSIMEGLKVGDVIDILGLSQGISDEWAAVVLEDCIIEPTGRLNLPVEEDRASLGTDY